MLNNLPKIIAVIQIILSGLLITAILLQQRGAGASAITGGSGGASYYTKRGLEKVLSIAIVVLAVLFIVAAIGSIIITARY